MKLLELFEDAVKVEVNGFQVGWMMIVLGLAMLAATFFVLALA